MLHCGHLVEERLRRRLAPLGVLPRQARVLHALDRMGPSSQKRLAEEFDVTAASMSGMTSRLIAAGLIVRARDGASRRGDALRLSPSGRRVLEQVHDAWAETDRLLEEALGPEGTETLARLARDLRDALGGRVPGVTPRRIR